MYPFSRNCLMPRSLYDAAMAQRITVLSTVDDARAKGYLRTLQNLFPKCGLADVHVAAAYTVDAKLTATEMKKAAQHLTHPTI